MQKYYISPLVGTGTRADPYKVYLAKFPGIAYASIIPSDPVTGAPTASWALCIVDALDHAPLIADNQLFTFPDATPDTLVSSLTNQERNRTRNALIKFGISTTVLDTSVTMRDFVNKLGVILEPTFDASAFNAVLVV